MVVIWLRAKKKPRLAGLLLVRWHLLYNSVVPLRLAVKEIAKIKETLWAY